MRRILVISLIILVLLESQAKADVVLIVRREAEAAGRYVRICDIARIEGPRDLATEIGRTVIGPTPPRGESLEITRWDIESRLYEIGINSQVVLTGNDSVRVFGEGFRRRVDGADLLALAELRPMLSHTSLPDLSATHASTGSAGAAAMTTPQQKKTGNPLDEMPAEAVDRVGKAISNFLSSRYARDDIEVEAKVLELSSPIPYAVHEIAVEKAVEGHVPGKAVLQLRVRETADERPRLVTVDADTVVYAPAPVAAKHLSKGESLSAADVVIKRVQMESGKGYFPPDANAVVGRELRRSLAPGDPVLADEAPVAEAVKRGDEVVVDTWSRGWRLTGYAKALSGGMIGDVIQVQDAGNKSKYDARITSPGVVTVVVKKRHPMAH